MKTGGLIALSQLRKAFFKLSLMNSGQNARGVYAALEHAQKITLKKSLRKGYQEMAEINVSLARMCLESDSDALQICEEKLTECE